MTYKDTTVSTWTISYHTPRGLTPQAQGTGPCSRQDAVFQAFVIIEIVTEPNNSPAMLVVVGLGAAASYVGRESIITAPQTAWTPPSVRPKLPHHQSTNGSATGQTPARIDQLIKFPLSMTLPKTETSRQIRQNARISSLCDSYAWYVVIERQGNHTTIGPLVDAGKSTALFRASTNPDESQSKQMRLSNFHSPSP